MNIEEDYDFVRVPSKSMDLLMETVSLDGSYSFDLKEDIGIAMESIRYFSSVWIVLSIDDEKQAHIKTFVYKHHAQTYLESLDANQNYVVVKSQIF